MSKEGLLTGNKERVFLALPLPLLLFAFVEIFVFTPIEVFFSGKVAYNFASIDQQILFRFVSNILLLNTLHVALSYVMLARLPELSNWRKEGGAGASWGTLLAIFVVAWGIFFFGGAFYPVEGSWRSIFAVVLAFAALFFPYLHSLRQTQGLSFVYSSASESESLSADSIEQKKKAMKFHKLEKYTFSALILFYTFGLVLFWGPILDWNQEFRVFWLGVMRDSGSVFARNMLLLLNLLCCFLIFYASYFRSGQKLFSSKNIFLLRVLLYPMSLLSYVALIGVAIVHGLEYWFVFRKMVSKSQASEKERVKTVRLGMLAMLLLALLALPSYLVAFHEFTLLLLWGFGATTGACVYTHYYVDWKLFRMKDSQTRKFVAPLLGNKES